MENDKAEKVLYWCCALGGVRECVLDCTKCLEEKGKVSPETIKEREIKYIDIKENKGNS